MRSEIREKRKLTFDNKRVTSDGIRQLAAIIDMEIKSVHHNENLALQFSLDATDDSSYESQSTVIYGTNGLIDKKPIEKISMKFSTEGFSKSIEVQIKHSINKSKENYITVSGDDPNWVNGVIARFTEVINLYEHQPQYKGWAAVFSLFFLGIVYCLYIKLILIPFRPLNKGLAELLLFGGFIAAFVIFIIIVDKFDKLLPAMELQTGPIYLQESRRKRNVLIAIFISVILPLILALIYDLFKKATGY